MDGFTLVNLKKANITGKGLSNFQMDLLAVVSGGKADNMDKELLSMMIRRHILVS